MRLYLARHGESEANLSRTFSNRDAWHPLTARGEADAHRLARLLQNEGITVLHTSPIVRARQTAEIVGAHLDLRVEMAEALREWDVGAWEGTNAAEGWAEYAEVVEAWMTGDHERRVSTGESLTEVVERFGAWLRDLRHRHGADERVLAIAHGGIYHAALPYLVEGCEPDFWRTRPLGHCDVVVVAADVGGLRCMSWGELDSAVG